MFLHKTVYEKHMVSCSKKYEDIQTIIDQKDIIKNIKKQLNKYKTNYNITKKQSDRYELLYDITKKELKELKEIHKDIISNLSSKTIVNKTVKIDNTVNINTFNRTDDEIKDIYENNLTVNHIMGGISSIASLIVDKVIKNNEGVPMITITDKSRGTAKYKLPTGELVIDSGFNKFTYKNRNLIMKKVYKIAQEGDNCSQILDTDTHLSKGYNQIVDDNDGDQLKRRIINNI